MGPLLEEISLANGSATLIISFDYPIKFSTSNIKQYQICNSLLVPAGEKITINTGDSTIAVCYLDAMGEDFHFLSKLSGAVRDNVHLDLKNEIDLKHGLKHIYKDKLDSNSADIELNRILNYRHYFDNPADYIRHKNLLKLDKRIESVISLIKEKIDDNVSIQTLAESVNLSEPRLMQLFKQQTGVPIRRYRLWHRLFTAGVKLSEGLNYTDAALTSGFTDSAHFSNTFKDMLGMSPTSILMQPNGLELIASVNPMLAENIALN